MAFTTLLLLPPPPSPSAETELRLRLAAAAAALPAIVHDIQNKLQVVTETHEYIAFQLAFGHGTVAENGRRSSSQHVQN